MKRDALSSMRRSKTKMGACVQVRSGFIPRAASTVLWRATREQLGTAARSGEPPTPHMLEQRTKSRGEEASQPQKMLKVKVDPEMYMKTKDRLTQWPKIIRAFVPGLRHFHENRRQSIGLLVSKCRFLHPSERSCDESRRSDHRPINPSAKRGVVLPRRDDPMVRRSERLAFPLCVSKQRG